MSAVADPPRPDEAPTVQNRRSRPRDRKATILRVAAELFASRGFASVSLTEIAEGVGISPGAMYRHFPGKEGVLDAVLIDALGAYDAIPRDVAATAAAHDETPEETLTRAVAGTVQLTLDRPALMATYLREHHRVGRGSLTALASKDIAQYTQWSELVTEVEPGLGRGEVAARLQASLGALVGMSVVRSTRGNIPGETDLVTSGIAAMLASPPFPRFHAVEAPPGPGWAPPPSRRQAFMLASVGLFRDHGYDGVGIDDLGAAVGISGPAVYTWVDSKAQILVDVFDLMVVRLAAGSRRAMQAARTAEEALEGLAREYTGVAYGNADLLLVTAREGYALPRDDQRRMARRRIDIREPWHAVLAEVRPELSSEQHGVLIEAVMHLVRQCTQNRRPSGPSAEATTDLALTFLREAAAGT